MFVAQQAATAASAPVILRGVSDLSLTEWRILSMIRMQGETGAAQIARTGQMDKGRISRALKGLTQKGQDTHSRLTGIMRKRQTMLTQYLSDEELQQFFRTLSKPESRARGDVASLTSALWRPCLGIPRPRGRGRLG